MSIRHHLSDELLLDYASGSLAEGWSIAVASHLALCPSCRKRLVKMEMAAGALLDDIEPASATTDDDWKKMKTRLYAEPVSAVVEQAVAQNTNVQAIGPILPEPLRSYVGGDVADLKWRSLGPGAYHFPIPTRDRETQVRLLRIPAGKPVPEHTHGGRELTLVLSGSFVDGNDVFARGDFEEADETLMHQPVASPGQECVCLAVTDAPLKFKSWLVRLVQPILGI
jgi:putative transcriptional regulator